MSTPEQRALEAQTRREKLEAKAPQLIEIVKKGQYFLSLTTTGVQEIYIWCELNPPRLYWEGSINANVTKATNTQGFQPKIQSIQNCLYLHNISDILVSQPNDMFTKHGLTGQALLSCVEFAISTENEHNPSPTSSQHKIDPNYNPQPLYLKAKDRLQLEVLVIAVGKLLENSGFEVQDTVPTTTTSSSSTTQQQQQGHLNQNQAIGQNNQTNTKLTTTTTSSQLNTNTISIPRIQLFETLTPKQIVKLLIKNHEQMTNIDIFPILDLLHTQGIPITRAYNNDTNTLSNPLITPQNPVQIEQTKLFFYPDITKGVLYWGQYKKPIGLMKLYEISELLCGKNTEFLKSTEMTQYEQSSCITLTSSTLLPSTSTDPNQSENRQFTSLIIVKGDIYDLNMLMFAVHRLVCNPASSEQMRIKYGKAAQNPYQQQTNDMKSATNGSNNDEQTTTVMLVKKNNNNPNDITIRPPSIAQQVGYNQHNMNTMNDSDHKNNDIVVKKHEFPNHMAWLLDQFQSVIDDTSNTNQQQSQQQQQSMPQLTEEHQVWIKHITHKAQEQRKIPITTLPSLQQHNSNYPTTSTSSTTTNSISNLSLTTNSIPTNNSTNGQLLREQCVSPVRQRFNAYNVESDKNLDYTVKMQQKLAKERELYKNHVAAKEEEIIMLKKQLEEQQLLFIEKNNQLQQHMEQERLKLEQQQEAQRELELKLQKEEEEAYQKRKAELENDDLTLQLASLTFNSSSNTLSTPGTPSKSTAEVYALKQSLLKAQQTHEKLSKKLAELDDTTIDLDTSSLSFNLDMTIDGTNNNIGIKNKKSFDFHTQIDLDDETRAILAEFTPHPDQNLLYTEPKLTTTNNNNDKLHNHENIIINDISSLLIDTTKEQILEPSHDVDQLVQSIALPSLPTTRSNTSSTPTSPNSSFNGSSKPCTSTARLSSNSTTSTTTTTTSQSIATKPIAKTTTTKPTTSTSKPPSQTPTPTLSPAPSTTTSTSTTTRPRPTGTTTTTTRPTTTTTSSTTTKPTTTTTTGSATRVGTRSTTTTTPTTTTKPTTTTTTRTTATTSKPAGSTTTTATTRTVGATTRTTATPKK